ncbi:MAG: tetratricopeptide repeat protein [Gemmatimonadetes bacterium]|nr:tetratricopeptide repeat protein [Gemmatimonadota bacterium]
MGNVTVFNGSAGIWRRAAIDAVGGWSADTLTEDLDLSYRCALAGWKGRYLRDVTVPSELPRNMRAFNLRPGSYEARWKAARAAVSLGLLAGDRDEGKRWLERASADGTAAVRIDPNGTDGLYWLIAATGRLSFLQSPRGAAQAAQRVYELAHRLLALDSLHAGAHDALGKLAYRVMRLSGAGRFFGRAFFGYEALRTASWERAERHLARAVELDPSWPVVHADLGEAYLHMGRYEEAARELQRALDLPGRHPGDRAYQQKAAEELAFARGMRKP